jgi:hypothetical protein
MAGTPDTPCRFSLNIVSPACWWLQTTARDLLLRAKHLLIHAIGGAPPIDPWHVRAFVATRRRAAGAFPWPHAPKHPASAKSHGRASHESGKASQSRAKGLGSAEIGTPDRPACAWHWDHVREPTRRHTRALIRNFQKPEKELMPCLVQVLARPRKVSRASRPRSLRVPPETLRLVT